MVIFLVWCEFTVQKVGNLALPEEKLEKPVCSKKGVIETLNANRQKSHKISKKTKALKRNARTHNANVPQNQNLKKRNCFSFSSVILASIFTTSSSLFCCPLLMPCSSRQKKRTGHLFNTSFRSPQHLPLSTPNIHRKNIQHAPTLGTPRKSPSRPFLRPSRWASRMAFRSTICCFRSSSS